MIVIDGFLSDKDFDEISSDELWESKCDDIKAGSPRMNWFAKGDEPNNIWERVCKQIFEGGAIDYRNEEYAGYEYWLNDYKEQPFLDVHQDKDEALWLEKQEYAFPVFGCAFYCHKEFPMGGSLIIHAGDEYEKILPVPNRLVIFQSNASHHVEEVTGGIRRGLTINIWKDKPLEQNFEDEGLSMDKYINKGLFDENGKPQGFNKDAV